MDTLRMTEVRKYGLNSCEVEERINVKEETTFNLRLNSYTRDVTPTFENTILIEGARDGSAGSFNNRIANVVTVLEAEQVLDNFGVAMIEDPKRIREGRPIDPMEAAPRQTFVRVAAESEVPDGTIEAYKTHVIQTSLVSVGGYCPVFTTGLPDFVPKSEQDPCIILAGDNWHLEQSTWRVPVIIRGRQAIPLGGTFENALRVDINRDGDETVIVEGATVRVTGALRIQPGARLVVRGRLIIGNPAIL
jgi:hypothetical protein